MKIVVGNNLAPPGLDELNTISQALSRIGFIIDAQRNNIIEESMSSFDDIRMLNENDIESIAKDLPSKTQVGDRMMFSIRRLKLLKGYLH